MNSGPPPDPNALRRDRPKDKDGWTTLPAEGRRGRAPGWPLAQLAVSPLDESGRIAKAQHRRELDMWQRVWKLPQAVMWERLGWTVEVALYVRLVVDAERSAATKALAEARQWSDRLGLNPAAMLRNRWRIADDELGQRRQERQAPQASGGRESVRDRMRAVNGGA